MKIREEEKKIAYEPMLPCACNMAVAFSVTFCWPFGTTAQIVINSRAFCRACVEGCNLITIITLNVEHFREQDTLR